jgi:RNA recognition motif-containing protein
LQLRGACTLQVVRDKRSNKSKGFGFVSFLESGDYAKALREMEGKYIGNRPCKLRKSSWQERNAHARGKWEKRQKTS